MVNKEDQYSVLLTLISSERPVFLNDCISSLFNQTVKPNEIVIVEEGELTQELYEIIQKWERLFEGRIKIVKVTAGIGFPASLNEGIKYCSNDFIARMDTDDICFPNRFEKQIGFMKNNPNVDCAGSWAIEVDELGNEYFLKKMPQTHEECFTFFKKRDCLIHPSVIFRKSFFYKSGMYPITAFDEDTLMWALGFKNGCIFSNLQEPLLYFRMDNNFFKRRRGWKRAISLFQKRWRINLMLHYGIDAYFYNLCFFLIRLLPQKLINLSYKTLR